MLSSFLCSGRTRARSGQLARSRRTPENSEDQEAAGGTRLVFLVRQFFNSHDFLRSIVLRAAILKKDVRGILCFAKNKQKFPQKCLILNINRI